MISSKPEIEAWRKGLIASHLLFGDFQESD